MFSLCLLMRTRRGVSLVQAELLDERGADPRTLDSVLRWRTLHPDIIRALAGDFPSPPLEMVPR